MEPGKNRNFVVQMYESEYRQIQAWVYKYQNLETGGDLFGLWADDNTAVVQLVLGPGEQCRRTSVSFYQDVDYLERVGNVLTNKEGLCHIGEWHSHHRIGLWRPSGGDENTVWTNMERYDIHRFFLFIANFDSAYYNHDVNIGCFLFEIDPNKERFPVLKGEICQFGNEQSPFRIRKSVEEHLDFGAESQNSSKSLNRFKPRGKRSAYPVVEQYPKKTKIKDVNKDIGISIDQKMDEESNNINNHEDKIKDMKNKDTEKSEFSQKKEVHENEIIVYTTQDKNAKKPLGSQQLNLTETAENQPSHPQLVGTKNGVLNSSADGKRSYKVTHIIDESEEQKNNEAKDKIQVLRAIEESNVGEATEERSPREISPIPIMINVKTQNDNSNNAMDKNEDTAIEDSPRFKPQLPASKICAENEPQDAQQNEERQASAVSREMKEKKIEDKPTNSPSIHDSDTEDENRGAFGLACGMRRSAKKKKERKTRKKESKEKEEDKKKEKKEQKKKKEKDGKKEQKKKEKDEKKEQKKEKDEKKKQKKKEKDEKKEQKKKEKDEKKEQKKKEKEKKKQREETKEFKAQKAK